MQQCLARIVTATSRIAVGAVCFCTLLLSVAGEMQAQTGPLRQRPRVALATPPAPGPTPSAPTKLSAVGASNKRIDLVWNASTESGGTITQYHVFHCQNTVGCANFPTNFAEVGTSTTTDFSDVSVDPATAYTYRVVATDANNNNSLPSDPFTLKTASSAHTCLLFPIRSGCVDYGTDKFANINAFYSTNGPLSFFNQIKSIYNGASGSATVSADLTTLNFSNGVQVNAATNIQAGSSGNTTNVAAGTIPTLSSNGAAQATQNVLYGGTVLASEKYPLLAGGGRLGSPGSLGFLVDLIGKQGFDIQNFKSGTNVNVSSPPFHASAQMEGYLQYNSINLGPASPSGVQSFAGALFVGGSYGYTYISHGYARDYGFGSRINNDIGQVSAGILINGVAKISVSRAYGPSQTFIDSCASPKLKSCLF